jgi:hypothetical protein
MGGPRITPEIKRLVIWTWWEMKQIGPEPTAKEVIKSVSLKLKADNKSHLHTPGLRKTQEILRLVRKELENRSKEQKELDSPWTIGSTIKNPINTEAMPAVLRVWKLCLAAGAPFTIREARWVAQLHTLFSDIVELRDMANMYATEEQVYELSKQLSKTEEVFATHDRDPQMVMELWEYATARQAGQVDTSLNPVENWPVFRKSFQTNVGDGKKAMEFATRTIIYKRGFERDLQGLEQELPPNLEEVREWKAKHPEPEELSDQAAWTYAYWLTYLGKGPKWSKLSQQETIDIMYKLQVWVLTLKPPESFEDVLLAQSKKGIASKKSSKELLDDFANFMKKPKKPELPPAELLKQVGYN